MCVCVFCVCVCFVCVYVCLGGNEMKLIKYILKKINGRKIYIWCI